jgi:hypothetical protein
MPGKGAALRVGSGRIGPEHLELDLVAAAPAGRGAIPPTRVRDPTCPSGKRV